jgi:hypothetical protein
MPVSPLPCHRGRDRAEPRRVAPGLSRVPALLYDPSDQQRQVEGRRAFRSAPGNKSASVVIFRISEPQHELEHCWPR